MSRDSDSDDGVSAEDELPLHERCRRSLVFALERSQSVQTGGQNARKKQFDELLAKISDLCLRRANDGYDFAHVLFLTDADYTVQMPRMSWIVHEQAPLFFSGCMVPPMAMRYHLMNADNLRGTARDVWNALVDASGPFAMRDVQIVPVATWETAVSDAVFETAINGNRGDRLNFQHLQASLGLLDLRMSICVRWVVN